MYALGWIQEVISCAFFFFRETEEMSCDLSGRGMGCRELHRDSSPLEWTCVWGDEGQRNDTIHCVAFCWREWHPCMEQAVLLSCGSVEIDETTGTFMKEMNCEKTSACVIWLALVSNIAYRKLKEKKSILFECVQWLWSSTVIYMNI